MIITAFIQKCIKVMYMLQEILKNDLVIQSLIKNTNFTYSQLDTFIINITLGSKVYLNKKINLRDNKKVSKGSFARTLRQAQNNLEKAIYTIIIAEYMSILDENTFSNLLKISDILQQARNTNANDSQMNVLLSQLKLRVTSLCRRKQYEHEFKENKKKS